MSSKQLPRVPEIENPQPTTPLTEDITTGTANDPVVGARGEEMTTITVDGKSIAVPPGSTIGDAMEAVETESYVPALCSYDRDTDAGDLVGPRSECRTCMVDTSEHGLVPSCSFPAEDGLVVKTDSPDAENARDVNLDLLLSNHNLRCTACGQNGRCELQDVSIENDVVEPRYGVFEERSEYAPVDDTHAAIQFDRNKCILCNRCVEACNDVQGAGVLRMSGSGGDIHVDFQKPDAETFEESTCISCGHCVTVCPTGSLVEKGLTDVATIPSKLFTQKNSVGKVIEHDPAETADTARAPNRAVPSGHDDRTNDTEIAKKSGVARMMATAKRQVTDAASSTGERAKRTFEHTAEDVAAETLSIGRLFDVATALADVRLRGVNVAETTCGYCAVGCRFDLYGKDGEILGVRPADEESTPANDFSTCVKGKFGYEFVGSDDRLTAPLIKEDGDFREASWEEAYDRVVSELTRIRDEHGEDTLAVTASSKCTNEENYLAQKFARQVLHTKNVDNCTRLCHSSTVSALKQTVGYGAMTNRINEDVARADCYLITGSNTTTSHPVLATRIVQNVRQGAELYVFDPRQVGIADVATQYTRTKPGEDIAWLNGMCRHIIENDLHDQGFVDERVQEGGFEDLREKVEPFTPEKVEELTDVPPAELKRAAEAIATADTCVFGWAMGLSQHAHGTRNVLALANLALITGHLGKPGAGLSPFRGQNNVQGGGGDMGPIPDNLPGYQELDSEVLDKFEEAWGVRPPDEEGLRVTEMFEEAHEGNLRGMFVVGENPVLSEPDIRNAEEAIQNLDFLCVQEVFMTETAKFADVVLPAATFAEKYGTVTNTERRVQLVRPAVSPPGAAKTDLEILCDLANRMGFSWEYDGAPAVMDEINSLVPIYGGITYDRLEAKGDGLQWPCWDAEHPGTPYLYAEEFNFEDGKARIVPADYAEPPDLPGEEYPLMLSTGRVLYHWHTGSLTRRVEAAMDQVGESFVTIHPEMAKTLGVADGEYVRVESKNGEIVVKAQVEDRHDPGVVFIPMHFVHGAVNELTEDELDPTSRIPEYKVTSVRVTPVGPDPDTHELPLQPPEVDVPSDDD